jgi:hypothetical protein
LVQSSDNSLDQTKSPVPGSQKIFKNRTELDFDIPTHTGKYKISAEGEAKEKRGVVPGMSVFMEK